MIIASALKIVSSDTAGLIATEIYKQNIALFKGLRFFFLLAMFSSEPFCQICHWEALGEAFFAHVEGDEK